jgi:subtilase family serine protease
VISIFTFGTAMAGCAAQTDSDAEAIAGIAAQADAPVCSGGLLSCESRIRIDRITRRAKPFATPSGFGPADLASAYKLDTSRNPGATIAIVDAFGYPNAESDLASYRSQFGLPPCTIASGCLTIVNQNGQSSPLPGTPPPGDDWTVETALDLDMASSACPHCKLLLVQADDDQGNGLFVAQAAAANLGATVISNSWGGPFDGNTSTDEAFFSGPSQTAGIFVSSGDSGNTGATPDYPSTSAFVTAVGGTSLSKSSTTRGWSEAAWSGAGSSCNPSIAKPSFQSSISTGCSGRAAADVSAVADPNTGVAVFNAGSGGWIAVGGTSASSPFVAGVMALTGHGHDGPGFAYGHTGDFFDVTTGSNGSCGAPLCTAGPGWDGPTGIGTPNGALLAGGTTSNDFSISATPASQTVAAGSSTTFNIATAITSGRAQSVSLSVSGLPTGATGSFSPASVTAGGSSTLTVSTTSSATAGTFTVTITGTGSAATHTTTVSLTVTGGTGGGGPTIASVTLARTTPPTSGNNGIVVVVNDTVSISDVILTWQFNGKVIKASAPNATPGWTVTQSGNKYTFSATIGTGARPWTVQANDSAGKTATKSGTFTFN